MKNLSKNICNVLIIALSLTALSASYASEKKWDVQPAVKKTVAPANPSGITGMVSALIEIDEKGMVINAEIAKTTNESLNAPVLEALKKWRFSPAKLDGKAIKCKIKVPFKFSS
ncbi:MAG: energy transducer TonB [Verrucomicrobiota bacterium]